MLVWAASYKVLRLIPILWTSTNKAQGKALSTPVSDINLAFLAALSLESKSENGVRQQHVLLCLVFQVFPDISSCEVPDLFNEAKLIDISVEGIPSYQTQTPSSLPYVLIIFHRHSLTKLILITQLTQLIQLTKLTLITQLTQLTQLTVTHSTHPTNCHSFNSSKPLN